MALISVQIDQRQLEHHVNTVLALLPQATAFAASETRLALRSVLPGVVYQLAQLAGPGFPEVYTRHLVSTIRNIPININLQGQFFELDLSIDSLGTKEDLLEGMHHQAILDYSRSSKARTLEQVDLPYVGQTLFTGRIAKDDDEARRDFWEEVVIGRNFNYELGLKKGANAQLTVAEFGLEVPTFEDIAMARVLMWGPDIAPEWLLLEYGYNESPPEIRPVDFSGRLSAVAQCIGQRIFTSAVSTLIELNKERATRIDTRVGSGTFGRARNVRGEFSEYKSQLNFAVGDYSNCLGI